MQQMSHPGADPEILPRDQLDAKLAERISSWDDLADVEEIIEQIGFEIGAADEDHPAYFEGYIFGFARAIEIRQKIAMYNEFIANSRKSSSLSENAEKALKKLEDMIQQMPNHNDHNFDIISHMQHMAIRYKQCATLLKIKCMDSPRVKDLSF